ncbi:hypothetical protein EDD15DRAFT_2477653 [Pisolithus albus]|nr:hypothetical protein EDD15DRAFT_2477653 [Pisolithus albus]
MHARTLGLSRYTCKQCKRSFRNRSGLTQHTHAKHPRFLTHLTPSNNYGQLPPVNDHPPEMEQELPNDSEMGMEDNIQAAFIGPGDVLFRNYHPGLTGQPCNAQGDFLPNGAQPEPRQPKSPDDWSPYNSRLEFELADFTYTRSQMSAVSLNVLLELWAASLVEAGGRPIFSSCREMYQTIDDTDVGDVKWQSFTVKYTGDMEANPAPWMHDEYDIWFRDPRKVVQNMLGNPEFAKEMDYQPFREYDTKSSMRRWQDFMSGDWAWRQADIIAQDPDCLGSTFVPIILGSDKTTVSVATGQNDYYPLYLSIGNIHNNVRRAHRNGVVLIAFLAMPKTTREHANKDNFRKFRRQLFHSTLGRILKSFKSGMVKPEVTLFGDGHYRRVIYGLGPYIADYEEQALLTCIVRNWCPRCLAYRNDLDDDNALHRCRDHTEMLISEFTLDALWNEYGIVGELVPFTHDFLRADIYELIAPDLLHQIIKGAFKDHLVEWVEKFLRHTHGDARANEILDDIDRRIAAIAPFPGLRRFPQGRHFKQWTGDDSKALMKVYLPAIEGHVPEEIIRTFRAFLEFCYLVRRNILTEKDLDDLDEVLAWFYRYREVFKTTGVVSSFSLPRQHAMKHYKQLIQLFGAPNGLCSSITESKHVKAVKRPYRRTNKYHALGQMLVINQRLDKLAASRADFESRSMLHGTCLSTALAQLASQNATRARLTEAHQQLSDADQDNESERPLGSASLDESQGDYEDVDGPRVEAHVCLAQTRQRNRPRTIVALADELNIPDLPKLVRIFLLGQLLPDNNRDPADIPPTECPGYEGRISIYHSASSTFYAPSDLSGIGGMRREYIRAAPTWRREGPRYDCVFVITDPTLEGMWGMDVARVLCFFSFKTRGISYPCAIVQWFDRVGEGPDETTGMWMVRPSFTPRRERNLAVIHVDTIFRAAHLIPIYGRDFVPRNIKPCHSYDVFHGFYVNKFADHHAFEIAY